VSEVVPFDYSQLDVGSQDALRGLAARLGQLAQDTSVGLWKMGGILTDAQEKLAAHGTGTFLKWLEAEVGLSQSTAYRLMQVHKAFDLPTVGRMAFSTSTLYYLSTGTVPASARQEAVRRAAEGETITPDVAREIVQAHRPAPLPPPLPPLPPEEPPEYLEFERETLMPQLHDAGVPEAPQLLSGAREELVLLPEEEQQRTTGSLREAILGVLTDFRDGQCADDCADELLEIMGQSSGSITLAAHFGIALTKGPLALVDLIEIACKIQGVRSKDLEREAYLATRKRVLRLLDSLTYARVGLYEHTLANRQLIYSLLSDT